MYRLEREDFLRSSHLWLWWVLGFQAGYLNAFGFLACGRYVSHVTGFGTQIGLALASGRHLFAIELLGFPVSFILGSFTSGLVTSARIEKGLKPRFDLITASIPLLIGCLLVLGKNDWFGPFGESLIRTRDFFLLFLLSFVCGMQNGCFAVLTKGQIRTTHLTGISTDIGTDFARIWSGKLQPGERELSWRAQVARLGTFISFTFGSILSVPFSEYAQYASLGLPLISSIVVFFAVRFVSQNLDKGDLKFESA